MAIYSYSRLNCYEQCPRKYKFQYIDKIKTEMKETIELFLGKRVHETLRKLYWDMWHQKMNSLGELLFFLREEWLNNWDESIVIVKKEYSREDYLNMAEQYISDYYSRYKPFNCGRTLAIEKRISINLDDLGKYKLMCYIDRITKTNYGYYQIHDYKTSSHLPTTRRIQMDRQLALYAMIVKLKYPYIKNIRLI